MHDGLLAVSDAHAVVCGFPYLQIVGPDTIRVGESQVGNAQWAEE